jgi:hypothetical protein
MFSALRTIIRQNRLAFIVCTATMNQSLYPLHREVVANLCHQRLPPSRYIVLRIIPAAVKNQLLNRGREYAVNAHLRPAQLQIVTFGWSWVADCATTRPIENASRADVVPCIVTVNLADSDAAGGRLGTWCEHGAMLEV